MKFRHQAFLFTPAVLLACALLAAPVEAQFFQQGPKLAGTGAIGASSQQGWSISLSGDGNTAIVGGYGDNGEVGAAWVFTRSDGVWSQQAKLVGTGAIGPALQGISVSISSDGNTAIVGGFNDDNAGASWIFTRSRGVWTQQAKLVGTGAIGNAQQGYSVALSSDGNSAIVGGYDDDEGVGAAWMFIRSGERWAQEAKLVGTGAIGNTQQGYSVAISGDGNTAIVGGPDDNDYVGAAWVFTRSSDGVWAQQGSKLVGTGAVGVFVRQSWSVYLSDNGNTAVVGGQGDEGTTGLGVGAAWVFTRSGGVRSQQGPNWWVQAM